MLANRYLTNVFCLLPCKKTIAESKEGIATLLEKENVKSTKRTLSFSTPRKMSLKCLTTSSRVYR